MYYFISIQRQRLSFSLCDLEYIQCTQYEQYTALCSLSPSTHSIISVDPFDYLRQPIRLSPLTHSTISVRVDPFNHLCFSVNPFDYARRPDRRIILNTLVWQLQSFLKLIFFFFSSGVYSERIFWHA